MNFSKFSNHLLKIHGFLIGIFWLAVDEGVDVEGPGVVDVDVEQVDPGVEPVVEQALSEADLLGSNSLDSEVKCNTSEPLLIVHDINPIEPGLKGGLTGLGPLGRALLAGGPPGLQGDPGGPPPEDPIAGLN